MFAVDLGEERRQITASKTPMERRRSSLVVSLKSEQPLFEFGQRRDVVGGKNLPLDDREEDLDLVEPTGMDWGMEENSIRPFGPHAVNGFLTSMSGAVVHNPEDAVSGFVGLLFHDLADETLHRRDPALDFAAAEDLGAMNAPSRQVGPGTFTKVLVLDSGGAIGTGCQRRLFAPARLDAGLLVGRDDELISSQWHALPDALIEIEDRASFSGKIGVARENPTTMLPWTKSIAAQPAPQRSATDFRNQSLSKDVLPNLLDGEPGQRKSEAMRKLTGKCLNVNDEAGGKSGPYARLEAAPQGQAVERGRIVCATC